MILPFGALPILNDLPWSRLSYINVGHAFIVQRLDFHCGHETPFWKRQSARDGSQPRPTILEEQIQTPQIGSQKFPKTVALGKRCGLSGAAFARPLRILISYNRN